uniref:Prokaryotic-type class I peptide chain release factors domain-containing protein n=1 Tax=Phlebotomus papatasi TaxID=29031 RepID=A0A1B0D698_PHLPP
MEALTATPQLKPKCCFRSSLNGPMQNYPLMSCNSILKAMQKCIDQQDWGSFCKYMLHLGTKQTDDRFLFIHLKVILAMLFTRDLYSMYRNYCDFKGWYTEVLEEDHMEIGGIRHASLCITGEDAFQCLKHEGGVHRVQRIPVTEKSGRVHTSTASVAIIPRPDDVTVTLNSKDLKIETKRASGAGGQHVNTTDSAVRITHIPTGLQVECQTDRSQIKNRELALKKLQARLYESEINAQMASTQNLRSSQVGMSMRNEKIRTYNFNQDRVTDHRIEDGTVHNLKGILEGREILDDFLDNLREKSHKKNLMEFIRRFKD